MKIEIHNIDCMELLKSIETESIDCLVTDPPYKIVSGGMTTSKNSCSGMLKPINKRWGDDITGLRKGKLFEHADIEFKTWLPEVYRVLKNGTDAYIMTNARNLKQLQIEADKVGFKFHNILVWNKLNATPNRWYMQGIEFILYMYKSPAKSINNMGTKNIFNIANPTNKLHPTEKPVELMKIFIENSTKKGDIVLDPFVGGGSAPIACKLNDREFIGSEIDENYFKVAINRINKVRKVEW